MKKTTLMTLAFIGLLLSPTPLRADAEKTEWFGSWAMNHDGHIGTLRIVDRPVDCAGPAWCDMSISYFDSRGVRHAGVIERIDDRGQHMVFYINFPGNRQKFDAYIFSGEKRKLAGTTYWGGRTFGFYAVRR